MISRSLKPKIFSTFQSNFSAAVLLYFADIFLLFADLFKRYQNNLLVIYFSLTFAFSHVCVWYPMCDVKLCWLHYSTFKGVFYNCSHLAFLVRSCCAHVFNVTPPSPWLKLCSFVNTFYSRRYYCWRWSKDDLQYIFPLLDRKPDRDHLLIVKSQTLAPQDKLYQ